MVGRASPRSLPIRLLTSPHDAIISNRWRSPQANFNTRCDGTARGAANLNREMIRLLDFAEQLEQAGDSILGLRRGREMRLIVHLIRNYLSGRMTTSSSLAAASGLSYGTAMR